MHKRSLAVIAVVVSVLVSAIGTTPVAAQQRSGGNGLKIAPVRIELTLDKGKSQTVSMFIENVTGTKATLQPVVNDFVADDKESGEPRILLDENQKAPGNSFKDLTAKRLAAVTLAPKERKELKINLTIPGNAASGGYYGAVRFVPTDTVSPTNVALTASVGTIFLIKVPGNITEKLSIASFDVNHNGKKGMLFNSSPITVTTRFKNEGNIHLQPFGRVTLTKNGKTLESIEINNNEPRSNVLPSSIRKFDTGLTKVGKLGRYTVDGNFGYGENGQLISARATFYVIPYWLIGLAVLLLAFLIVVLPQLIRMYNRRIIAHSRR